MVNQNDKDPTTECPPINIPPEKLNCMKVADLKLELLRRKVCFPSKTRKQGLLDLLQASLHLPTLAESGRQQPKGSKKGPNTEKQTQTHWKTDHPVRKLLCFEFKEGNVPLDPNEMGPAEIFCTYTDNTEFEGIEHNDAFIKRLKALRLHVMKEEPLLKWTELHPARKLLFDELTSGVIPLDAEQMSAAEVWCRCSAQSQFKMRGMKHNETFKRRLAALRKLIKKDKNRATEDKIEVARAIRNHMPPALNHRGEPQWNGSKAQELLKEDIANNKHLVPNFKPSELRMQADRPEHRECSMETFRWKIQQEVRTNKHLHTLKHDAEQKLRKNLKKMSITE